MPSIIKFIVRDYFYVLIIVAAFFCFTRSAYSQEQQINQNSISINGGTTLLFYSRAGVNYERLLKVSETKFISRYFINAGLGRFVRGNGFAPAPIPRGIETALNFIILTGNNSNHLELGTGLSVGFVTSVRFADQNSEVENTITYANFLMGYRYQNPKGILFRIGAAWPVGLYTGLGFSF
jgi:hypothetical protein